MGAMAGLLDLLRQLISSLLYRGEEGSKRLELRNIHQRLRGYKPPLFRPRGAVLLPGLAARLLQLSRSLEPLQAVFRQTLSHEDSETAQRYRDWLVEARLPSNLEARRIIFTYNEMKRMIAPGAASEVALKAIADEFGRYMNSFGGEVYLGFDEAMTSCSLLTMESSRTPRRWRRWPPATWRNLKRQMSECSRRSHR